MKKFKLNWLNILLFICLAVSVTTSYISNNNLKKLEKAYIELNEDYSKLEKYKVLDDTLKIKSLSDGKEKISKLIKYSKSKLFRESIEKIYFTLMQSSLQLSESNVYLNNKNTIKRNNEINEVIKDIIY